MSKKYRKVSGNKIGRKLDKQIEGYIRKTGRRKRNRKAAFAFPVLLLLCLLYAGFFFIQHTSSGYSWYEKSILADFIDITYEGGGSSQEEAYVSSQDEKEYGDLQKVRDFVKDVPSGEMQVHFIDVGQADCTLLILDGEAMMIDAGNHGDAARIQEYLETCKVDSLKYLLLTHNHEDHIGSADEVMKVMPVEQIIMNDKEIDSAPYRYVMEEINAQNKSITAPHAGDTYTLGEASFTIITALKDAKNLNDTSIGIRLTYGNTSFLFYGDGESKVEDALLDSEFNLEADVLKIPHHSSLTSSKEEIVAEIHPSYGVISCGRDNDYGYPKEATMEKYEKRGTVLFRTDTQGDVICISDGERLSWNVEQ